jgi:hypothetical protein
LPAFVARTSPMPGVTAARSCGRIEAPPTATAAALVGASVSRS